MAEQSAAVRVPAGTADYERLRQRHVALFEALFAGCCDRIGWSAEQLRTERLRLLRAVLLEAVKRSSWHRERLAGVDVREILESDMEALPVMTKTDLMANFDDIVTDRRITRELCERHLEELSRDAYLLGEYHVVASGGSSGQRGVFVYGWDAWAILWASIARFQHRDWDCDPTLVGVPQVIALVAASKATHISAATRQTFSTARNPEHLFPVSLPLEQIIAGLNELQPTMLTGYSSFLQRLALEARARRLRITPRRVKAIAEPLLPEARAAIEAAWGVPIANAYGMSEGVFAGFCGHGTHLPDDLCLVEPVDAAGNAVARGVPSARVYVTNLYNSVLPLIRFEVTDEITVLDTACPCGSAMRRIADPQGRLDETFVYGMGVSVHPHLFRSALGEEPEIIEYQVHQTDRGARIEIIAESKIDTRRIGRKIEQAIVALGVAQPEVTIVPVAALTRLTTGKLRRFVPLAH